MSAISYRSTKGSPLTADEVDGNFRALNEGKLDLNSVDATVSASDSLALYGVNSAIMRASSGDATVESDGGYAFVIAGNRAVISGTNGVNLNSVLGEIRMNSPTIVIPVDSCRIKGDFSNSDFSKRTAFQDRNTDSETKVTAIPSGTGDGASWQAWTSSAVNNCYRAYLQVYEGAIKFAEVGLESVGTPVTLHTDMLFRVSMYGASQLEFIYGGSSGTDYYASLPMGRLKFPATQNPSTDPNTFDDYSEVDTTNTLTVTCGTPGDLSVVYAQRILGITKVGRRVYLDFQITFTPTFTTASGALLISTLGYVSNGSMQFYGSCITNIVKAIYNNINSRIGGASASAIELIASDLAGSGFAALQIGDCISGSPYIVRGNIGFNSV